MPANTELLMMHPDIVAVFTFVIIKGELAEEIVQFVRDEPSWFKVMPVQLPEVDVKVTPFADNAPLTTRLAPEGKFKVVPEVSVSVAPEFIVSEPANVYVPACNVAFEATTE